MPPSSSEAARPVAAAAVVCLKADCVLLVQRAREPNRGRWSYPGGKIEPGETARETAEREALEETGIPVRALGVVDVYDAIFPPYHYCVADYLAVPTDDREPTALSDAMDARWVPFDEVPAYDVTEAMLAVLERARWMRSTAFDAPPPLGMDPDARPPAGVPASVRGRNRVAGLYFVTDEEVAPGRSHADLAAAALQGGARIVQLRDKRADAGLLLPAALRIRELCRQYGALFIVNDRVDLALACGADGVHLGQTDLPVFHARAMLGEDKLIGVSVENEAQVLAAVDAGADYLGVGPIFATASKPDAGDAVGLGQIRRFRGLCGLPIVAIGGLSAGKVRDVIDAGANSAAVIGAVAAAPDPEQAARELASEFSQPLVQGGAAA